MREIKSNYEYRATFYRIVALIEMEQLFININSLFNLYYSPLKNKIQ